MKKLRPIIVFAMLFILTACGGPLQTVQMVSSGFLSARAATQGYYAMKMAKEMKNAKPLFQNYQHFRVEVLLNPREGDAEVLAKAFKDNLEWLIPKDVEVAGLNMTPCYDNCTGKTIIIQFKEENYGTSLAKKLLIGEKLKGKLYLIDAQTATLIDEKPLEVAKNYEDLIKGIHTYIGMIALKTLEAERNAEKMKKAVDEFNKMDPIKEEYKELFARSR